ncbi:uncharacterized protein N7482_004087 [Penicillium canariense]|uniref:Uncharacterized protein n=1 Tax=Penicillium canariense TaxID=189055 RepID=A0A9W9I823_9EURO|nr:uncharacterized protein N7482_004087 [Penicillium canariense]KAJ5168493.1 hypothetical protein N7482_004087 [Penicillium canariense]
MASAHYPYNPLFHQVKGMRSFPGFPRNEQFHPVFVNGPGGGLCPMSPRSFRCSAPTTPPAERRARAAQGRAHRGQNGFPPASSPEQSKSTRTHAQCPHCYLARQGRAPVPVPVPQTKKQQGKNARKAPKPAELPHQCESAPNWGTNGQIPRDAHHCPHSPHCMHKVGLGPQYHHPQTVGPRACYCSYLHVEPPRASPLPPSPIRHRTPSPGADARARFFCFHCHAHGHNHGHAHVDDSSSDTEATDDTGSEGSADADSGDERVPNELQPGLFVCGPFCHGHPAVFTKG